MTTVTSQINPSPPVLSTPLLHCVVGAAVAAPTRSGVEATVPSAIRTAVATACHRRPEVLLGCRVMS